MKLSYSGHNMDHMEICRILVIFDGKRQKMNRINDLLIETALVSILNLIPGSNKFFIFGPKGGRRRIKSIFITNMVHMELIPVN